MQLTAGQRAAVNHRGADLLLSASAGSGKTEVLARRCVALVSDPQQPTDIHRLLVLTFTRAAAQELRARIGRMLRAAAHDARRDLRRHLLRQATLVESAEIGTIDAWCGRVLREFFAEAGVDPAFRVLSDYEAAAMHNACLDDLLAWVYRADDSRATAARAWLAASDSFDDRFLRELIQKLHRFREHLVWPEQWLAAEARRLAQPDDVLMAEAEAVLRSALGGELQFQITQLAALIDGVHAEALRQSLRQLHTDMGACCGLCQPSRDLATAAEAVSKLRVRTPRDCDPLEAALLEEIKKRWLEARLKNRWGPDVVRQALESAVPTARYLETLLALEGRYNTLIKTRKQAAAAYEFADVQRLTLELIAQPDETGQPVATDRAEMLRERYDHVLIDEFQDTSPIQVALLRLIARPAGNRFMVGDVKQSIYGFREAEPRLFAEQVAAFAAKTTAGRVLYLSDSFRSHATLVDVLNDLFGGLFRADFGGTDFTSQERLVAGRAAAELPNPSLVGKARVELYALEAEERRGSADEEDTDADLERIEREAHVAADRIAALFAAETRVPERDAAGTPTLRPVALRDIVVLLRSAKGNAGRVASILRERGLAAVAGGREALLDLPEVRDLHETLRLLSNRRADLALASYLRGPFVALSPQALHEIRQHHPDGDLIDAVGEYCESGADRSLCAALAAAVDQLERWEAAARTSTVSGLLRRMIHDGKLDTYVAGLRGGAQRGATLAEFVLFAEKFGEGIRGSVPDFVALLDELRAAKLDPGVDVAPGRDVIRVMTIHAAKGLEFPFVFVLNAGAKFNQSVLRHALQCDQEHGLGLRFFDYPLRKTLADVNHQVARYRALGKELEEDLRLLYVALTRAREQVVVIGHTTPGRWDAIAAAYVGQVVPLIARQTARSMFEWLLLASASKRLHEAADQAAPAVTVQTCPADAVTGPDEPRAHGASRSGNTTEADDPWVAAAAELITQPASSRPEQPAVVSVSTLKTLAGRGGAAVGRDATRLGLPEFASEAHSAGTTFGTLVHAFLQHVDLQALRTDADIERERARVVARGIIEAEAARSLPVADLRWFGNTELGRRIAQKHDQCLREQSFVYLLPGDDPADRTLVRGVIDLLLHDTAGLTLVDYKTDRLADDAALAERVRGYGIQLRAYAAAAEALWGQPVEAAWLVFLSHQQLHAVPPEPVDWSWFLAQGLAKTDEA